MKIFKYLLFSLFLILSFNVSVNAYTQSRFYWDIDGFINNTKVWSSYLGLNTYKTIPVNDGVGVKLEIKTYGNIYDSTVENPQGLILNISLSVCTTELPRFNGVTDYTNFTGHLTFLSQKSNKVVGVCKVAGYTGNIRKIVFDVFLSGSTYDVDGDFYYSLGTATYWGANGLTTYTNYVKIISVQIETSNIENSIIFEKEQQAETTNAGILATLQNTFSKIASIPSDIWNGIKTGFNWIVDGLIDVGDFILTLPSGIWNAIKTGFTWIVDALGDVGDFIISLPSDIWNGIKTGFNWIVDGVTNLLNFFDNDDDVDVNGLSSIGLLPAGPVDSILNLPFTFLDNLNTNLTKQCVSTNLPLPYINKNLPLPCVNSIYSQIGGLNTFISSFSVILSAFILFKYLINLYKWVDRTLSFRENNHLDNWGGL